MTETHPRRRAPGMSAEQRRGMIVAAALPLVAEYGAAVTSSQIARAAGIGEATIFRAFRDKDEVLDACMAEAARADHVLRELAAIPIDQPLQARLMDAIDAVRGHLARMGAVAGALHASGHRRAADRPAPRPEPRPEPRPSDRTDAMNAIRDAVTDLIEPDAGTLRFPPHQVAAIFLSMLFTQTRRPTTDQAEFSDAQLVDVLLHGAAVEAGGPQ